VRAELGLSAYTRAFAETNDLPQCFTAQDIAAHKLFKFSSVSVGMKYVPVNLMGVARPGQSIESKQYTSISISNFGSPDKSSASNANPSRTWLEVISVEADPKKRNRKEDTHLYYVSVVDLETEDKKKLVDVVLDGEYYGSVYRIKISICTAPSIATHTHPTFSPNSLPSSTTPNGTLTSASVAALTLSPSTSSISPPPPASPPHEEEPVVFPVMTYLPLELT